MVEWGQIYESPMSMPIPSRVARTRSGWYHAKHESYDTLQLLKLILEYLA
jgi:hypothetical protein